MVQEAKRVMDSRGFDYFIKVLGLLQAAALAILVPLLMGMSERQQQIALEFTEFRATVVNRLPDKFPPIEWRERVTNLERELHKLELIILQHCAEDKKE